MAFFPSDYGYSESGSTAETGFEVFRKKVDAGCWKRLGVSLDDLPDVPLTDWYEDGFTAAECVTKARRYADGEDE